jgi:hypothetical protein
MGGCNGSIAGNIHTSASQNTWLETEGEGNVKEGEGDVKEEGRRKDVCVCVKEEGRRRGWRGTE